MKSPPLAADPFRLLGDEVRLRLLRVLGRERLNVGELTRILGLAQSGVSRHVRLLREGGLVVEAREAGYTHVGLPEEPPPGLGDLWPTLRARIVEAPDLAGDDARLEEVRRERDERRVGWGAAARPPEPGRSWAAWARALGHLLPPAEVVHLGAGEGALTLEVARWARRVVGVEPDRAALRRARASARSAGRTNVRWVCAPLEALPLASGSADVALLSQVLHAVPEPERVVKEAARATRPGGTVLVLDLLPHGEAWVEERLGHRRRGLSPEEVAAWFAAAGVSDVKVEEAARRRGNPFTVLVASGRRGGRP
jgi:ArsR family transcriptional regulator